MQLWTYYVVDDLYLHERSVVCMSRRLLHINSGNGRGVWLWWPTNMYYLWPLQVMPLNSKHSFSPNLTDLLCLWATKVPKCSDQAIFFVDNDNNIDRTYYFIPCTCMWGTCNNHSASKSSHKFREQILKLNHDWIIVVIITANGWHYCTIHMLTVTLTSTTSHPQSLYFWSWVILHRMK